LGEAPRLSWTGALVVLALSACVAPVDKASPTATRAQRPERSPRRARADASLRPALEHPRLQELVLPSGLRVLLDEDPHATVAGAVTVAPGGSTADPPGAEGLAHLVEHLVYRAVDPASPAAPGTAAGRGDITRRDAFTHHAVVAMNAHTTPDCLLFYEFGPPSRLEDLLGLTIARMADPLVGVSEEAFALERRIIGAESRFREDTQRTAWAANELYPILFPPPHPYARPTGGTEDSRRTLTLDQARGYAAKTFRPERMTLLVSAPPGATSLAAIAARLPPALRGDATHPVARPARAAPAPEARGPQLPAAKLERRVSALPTPELWIAWPLPDGYGVDGPAEEVLSHWAQEDVGSEQVLQEEPSIRHVGVTVQPGLNASVLFVRALLAEGADPDRVARVLTARVSSLWAREPAQRPMFARLKSLYETYQALDQPTQLPRALDEAMQAGLGERPQQMAEVANALQSVASTAVAELAYRHLTRERARAVMFMPAPLSAGAQRAGVLSHFASHDATARELLAGAGRWNAGDLAGLLPPAETVISKKLPSGLTIVTVRRAAAAAVAWLVFRRGTSDADPPLLAELAARVRPDAQGATKLHMLVGRGTTRDMSFDTVEFLPDQLPEALTLLFAKATASVTEWPSKEGLARLLAPALASEDAPSRKADREFWRALFGDHPLARLVSAEDVDKLTRSDVDAWLGRVHIVRNAALVVVGDVDPDEVERAATVLARRMKAPAWIADPEEPPALRPARGTTPSAAPIAVVNARRGTLTEIRLGCLLPAMATAERNSYELLATAMEARLDAALRADDGDSYGASVRFEGLRGGTTFLVASSHVNQETLARSLAALRTNWQRWSREGFDTGEFNVARWRYVGGIALRQGSGNALAYELARTWIREPAAVTARAAVGDIGGLRVERINELFATCKASAVLGLTGNEAVIRRALAEAWPGLAAKR
jgi:zinc protease